jgi:hypothetical protein
MLEAESAIASDVIAERGYFSVETRKDLKAAFGSDRYADHLPGLVIAVFNVHGDLALNIVRFDHPPIRDGKARKYLLPHRAHAAVDVPRRVRPGLGDPAVPLWMTEGSKKVDALVSAGVNAIGLTGVWNWRGTNEHGGRTLLADFESIALNDGREIHIVFDSDVMWKTASGSRSNGSATSRARAAPTYCCTTCPRRSRHDGPREGRRRRLPRRRRHDHGPDAPRDARAAATARRVRLHTGRGWGS